MIWRCLGACCRPIPQRFIVATMALLALSVQYIDRLSFNLAITEITYKETKEKQDFEGACPFNESGQSIDPNLKAEFHWSIQEQANLLGSFYFGYMATHLPGGVLSDWYGPKWVLGIGTFVSGLCVFFTPLCARLAESPWPLVINRIVMGLAQGPLFPAISSFVARWSLPEERNIMSSYMNMGINVGAISSNLGTGYLLFYLSSWDTVFYIYGVLTFVFCVLWYLFAHDSPMKHPFITDGERGAIVDSIKDERKEGRTKIPIAAIFKSVPVYAAIIANIGHDWKFYIVITLLPQYISYVLHMDVVDNGLINSGPYVTMFLVSIFSGKLSEHVLKKGWLSKTLQCKIWTIISNMSPCVFFILASYGGCNHFIAVSCFILAFSFVGFAYASIRVVNVHLSPNYAGLLMSFMNGVGCICGILGPKVFAIFTDQQSVMAWRTGFLLSFGIVGMATLFFVIFGTAELQPWNEQASPSEEEPPPSTSQGNPVKTD